MRCLFSPLVIQSRETSSGYRFVRCKGSRDQLFLLVPLEEAVTHVGLSNPSPRWTISQRSLREVRGSGAGRNTTTKEDSSLLRLRYHLGAASWPTAELRFPLQPIVLGYQRGRWIVPTRRGHTAVFPRRYWSTRRMSLAPSLLPPLPRRMPSEVPEPYAPAGACSFVRHNTSRHLHKCQRSELLSVYPT